MVKKSEIIFEDLNEVSPYIDLNYKKKIFTSGDIDFEMPQSQCHLSRCFFVFFYIANNIPQTNPIACSDIFDDWQFVGDPIQHQESGLAAIASPPANQYPKPLRKKY